MSTRTGLDRTELAAACLALARHALAPRHGARDADVENLACELARIALEHERLVIEARRDPALLIRLVRFIERRVSPPDRVGDTTWFSIALETLLEVACPTGEPRPEDEIVSRDLAEGVAASRACLDNLEQDLVP